MEVEPSPHRAMCICESVEHKVLLWHFLTTMETILNLKFNNNMKKREFNVQFGLFSTVSDLKQRWNKLHSKISIVSSDKILNYFILSRISACSSGISAFIRT